MKVDISYAFMDLFFDELLPQPQVSPWLDVFEIFNASLEVDVEVGPYFILVFIPCYCFYIS